MQATYTKNGRTFLLDYDQASLEADVLAGAMVALSGAQPTIDWCETWLSVHDESFDTSVAEREWRECHQDVTWLAARICDGRFPLGLLTEQIFDAQEAIR